MQAANASDDRLRAARRRHASGHRPEGVHGPGQDRRRDRRDASDLLAGAATNGSALATAGDLVFFGDLNRRLRAFDADSGKVLWETVVGGMIVNSTITYAVNGKQYVMVYTGGGQSVTSGPLAVTEGHAAGRVRTQRDLRVRLALTTKGMDHPKLKTALVTRGHTQGLKDGTVKPRGVRFRVRGSAGRHQRLPPDGQGTRLRRLRNGDHHLYLRARVGQRLHGPASLLDAGSAPRRHRLQHESRHPLAERSRRGEESASIADTPSPQVSGPGAYSSIGTAWT